MRSLVSAALYLSSVMMRAEPPKIDLTALPPAEHTEAKHINWLLGVLQSYRNQFEASIYLMVFSHQQLGRLQPDNPNREFVSLWPEIAMKYAAAAIYHFGYIVSGILKSTHHCPKLMKQLEMTKLNTAHPLFKTNFPDYKRLRDAAFHSGEAQHTLTDLEKNRFAGTLNVGGIAVSGWSGGTIISGDTIYLTHKRKVVSLQLSKSNLDKLHSVLEIIYEVFSAPKPQESSEQPKEG